MTSRGELWINHFDRAIMEHMCADFLNLPGDVSSLPRQLKRPQRQVAIPGVTGSGQDGRVLIVWDQPEDVYNRYVLPGMNVKRSVGPVVDTGPRQFGWRSGYKYRVPSSQANMVSVTTPGGVITGPDEVVMRPHPEPVTISYDLHVRARDEVTALRMQRFLRQTFIHRDYLTVFDTENCPSTYTFYIESQDEISETIDSLNSYEGWLLTIMVEAELDYLPEYKSGTVTERPGVIADIYPGPSSGPSE